MILVESLGAKDAAPAAPTGAVLEALRARLVAAFSAGRGRDLARRDLRDAPWVLWTGTPPGATIRGLLEAVLAQAAGSSRTTRNLIEAWLRDFSPEAPSIAVAGLAIQRLLASGSDTRLDLWRGAHDRFALFDARHGPQNLARALTAGPGSVQEVLAAAGFDDALRASGGYMRETLRAVLRAAPGILRSPSAAAGLSRILEVLAPGRELRFGAELRGDIGRGLLNAWLDGGREPATAQRDAVRDFLLAHLGDPRLRAPNWTPVGEQGTALMRRWLARASLKAFFELIADHALDEQWRYREAFWSACLEKGAIDDAWLALGSRVHASARAIRDLSGAYGRLEGGRVAGDQSVLLLRVGPLIFCEWSHNGRLRAWPADWQSAPALHRASYTRDDLTRKGLPFPPNQQFGSRGSADGMGLSHIGSDRSYWQGSAAELLARRARVYLTEADWKPR
jgi:hypothetical protein